MPDPLDPPSHDARKNGKWAEFKRTAGERYRYWVLLLTFIGVLVGVIGVMVRHGFK
jgi:hypothetical protein